MFDNLQQNGHGKNWGVSLNIGVSGVVFREKVSTGVQCGKAGLYADLMPCLTIRGGLKMILFVLQRGNATILKPTLMCAVPVVLDRIYKGINQGSRSKANSSKTAKLFRNLLTEAYKLNYLVCMLHDSFYGRSALTA